MLDKISLEQQICEIVSECLGLDQIVTAEQTFQELGADSIDMATLIVTLQDDYPANSIEDHELAEIKTPAHIISLIKSAS